MKEAYLTMAILFFSSCADILSGNSEEERKLFQQVKIGMTSSEVEEILGKPDGFHTDSSNTMYYYYFTENKNGRSTLPYVMFDSSGKVAFATYGDGG